ncbi:hypothetical protein [Bosea sp. R86505]|uniref:hypothetical protein n=1 Tax=Bosea sp. R86505 TaxID=3101710 RepID=UPI00366E428E
MMRATTICLGLMMMGLCLPGGWGSAQAAGPATKPLATAAPNVQRGAAVHQRLTRERWVRTDAGRFRDGHGRRFGRGPLAAVGYPGAWGGPSGGISSHALDAPRPVDRQSFEHMPVRMGIARAPTPEPTLYRLEGRRDRPATRVIRISDPEPRQGRRTRFAHAETGALLLIVPGR